MTMWPCMPIVWWQIHIPMFSKFWQQGSKIRSKNMPMNYRSWPQNDTWLCRFGQVWASARVYQAGWGYCIWLKTCSPLQEILVTWPDWMESFGNDSWPIVWIARQSRRMRLSLKERQMGLEWACCSTISCSPCHSNPLWPRIMIIWLKEPVHAGAFSFREDGGMQ
jgi:hypothetical protein